MKALPIDKAFTKLYVTQLKDFLSTFVAHTSAIKSHKHSIHEAVSNLKNETGIMVSRLAKHHQAVNGHLSLAPNIMLEMKNPLKKSHPDHSFFISVGAIIKIKDSLLVEQSIQLTILYKLKCDLTLDDSNNFNCHTYQKGIHVLRKFHFDIDRQISNWPLSHLQYGGAYKQEHNSFDEEVDYRLFSMLDLPRLPHPPCSLIMCLDTILRCFETEASAVTKEKYWQSAVRASEDTWLKPFYQLALNYLSSSNRDGTLYDYFSSRA